MYLWYGEIALQIVCGIHAVKNGRFGWLFIILFFPLVGCLIYFIVEIYPDLRASSAGITQQVSKTINPGGELKQLKEEFDLCDSLENRQALADAYLAGGQYPEAIKLLEEGLVGALQNDPYLLGHLARAYYLVKEYDKTKEALKKIKDQTHKFEQQQWHLLYALALNKVGDIEAARAEFEEVITYYAGEEARYRYAMFLKAQGEGARARELLEKTVKKCKISPGFYRKEQARWLKLARQELEGK